jgi:hypothetical protein
MSIIRFTSHVINPLLSQMVPSYKHLEFIFILKTTSLVFFIFFFSFIHMCIQCLSHLSPFPHPLLSLHPLPLSLYSLASRQKLFCPYL